MGRAKRIFCVVAYDIREDKRRLRVMKRLERHGVRINYSVYECLFTRSSFDKIRTELCRWIDRTEDRIVFYPICVDCYTRIVYCPDRRKKPERVVVV